MGLRVNAKTGAWGVLQGLRKFIFPPLPEVSRGTVGEHRREVDEETTTERIKRVSRSANPSGGISAGRLVVLESAAALGGA